MRLIVEVKNEVLGDSIFWNGDESDIRQIRNVVALNLAQEVIKDGVTRKSGMWIVSMEEE